MAEVTGLRPFSSDIERKQISPKVVTNTTPKDNQQAPSEQKVTVQDKFGVAGNNKVDSNTTYDKGRANDRSECGTNNPSQD